MGQVVVEHEADTHTPVGQVGHRAPALVHLQRPVLDANDASAQVLAEGNRSQVEQPIVAGLLVQAYEEQCLSGRAPYQPCVRVIATAELWDAALIAQPFGDDGRHSPRVIL